MRAGGVNNMKNYKIAVAGTGYVGLSIATLLSQHHQVTAVDIVPEKVEMINNRKSPIQDDYIEKYLAEKELNLTATLDAKTAYADADFVVIAAPTNYDMDACYKDREVDWKMTSRGIWYFRDGKSVVISFSHPEARVKDAYLFYALTDAVKEIMRCEKFEEQL